MVRHNEEGKVNEEEEGEKLMLDGVGMLDWTRSMYEIVF